MKMTGAEIISNVLIEQGAEQVFGYPGGAVINIYDALYKYRDKITHYLTAHEQGAAHAADGYARSTGKTGVVIATSGPGATNLVTGIATAFMDSVPMVAITGNVGSSLIGKDSFQEVYTLGITMPITKHNFFVQDVNLLADTLREAFKIANSGRKGPVLVDITKDVTVAEGDYEPQNAYKHETPPYENDEEIWEILRYMGRSSRPLICFGGGVIASEAGEVLHELVHKAQIPAVHTLMGTGVLSYGDELNLGLAGMHGFYSGNMALDNADLILALGFRFSDRVALNTAKWARKAKIVQIDIDPSEVNKNVEVSHAVVGDIKQILSRLLPMLENTKHEQWLAEIAEWKKDDYKPQDASDHLRPHQVIGTIAKTAGEDAILVTDVGQHQMWSAQYCCRTKSRSFLTSGGLGTMGFGYGAAIGAKVANPERRVVHITGDGSFHMNMNEACTAVSYGLNVVTVILDNKVLGMVRQWQATFFNERYSNTTLERKTDYVKVIEGFGGTGFLANTPAELENALQQAFKVDGPAWIVCPIERDEKVLPMIPAGGTIKDIMID